MKYAVFNSPYYCQYKTTSKSFWAFDRNVKPDDNDWEDIAKTLMLDPLICNQKEHAPLVSYQSFTKIENHIEDIKNEKLNFFDKNPEDNSPPLVKWNKYEGQWYSRAVAGNVLTITALPVDMENEAWPIEQFIEKFRNFEFVLTTSFKHRSEPEHNYRHRYRAVFPLLTPMPVKHCLRPDAIPDTEWTVLPILNQIFMGADPTSFERARCVYFPCSHPDRIDQYVSIHNKGNFIDWMELGKTSGTLKPYVPPPQPMPGSMLARMAKKKSRAFQQWNGFGITNCPFVKPDKLDEYLTSPHGTHHNGLFRLGCSMAATAAKMEQPLDLQVLEMLLRDAHLQLPCGQCSKSGKDYSKLASDILRKISAS